MSVIRSAAWFIGSGAHGRWQWLLRWIEGPHGDDRFPTVLDLGLAGSPVSNDLWWTVSDGLNRVGVSPFLESQTLQIIVLGMASSGRLGKHRVHANLT